MKKIRNTAVCVAVILSMIIVSGCTTYDNFKATFFSEQGVDSENIKIGVLEPQTGNDSKMGQEEIRGIELAHKQVPSVLDKDIELVFADTQSSIYVTETVTADLIKKDPAVVLGSYGDTVTLIASQKLGKARIPAIAITATNPLITTNNPYYFRVSFTDASQGKALAHYVVEKLKQNKAAIIRMAEDDTTTDLISKFKGRLRRLTEKEDCIAVTIDLAEKENDYETHLQEIKDSKVKAVFMPVSLTVAEKIFAMAEKLGMTDVDFIVPKALHGDDLLRVAGKYSDIRISAASDLVSHVDEVADSDAQTTSAYNQFVEAYKAAYQGAEPTEAAALAFDAYMIAVKAIQTSKDTEPDKVKDAILNTKGYIGVSGNISFDEAGEPKKPINVDIIQKGMYVSVFTVR